MNAEGTVMKKLIGTFLLVSFLAAFSSCGYKSIKHGSEISEGEVEGIADGKTTKDEIYIKFGEPKKILEDGKVFIYNWVRGSKWHILGFGSGSAYGTSLIVTFDERGIVKGHRITRGEVEGGTQVHD
jgi:hypothetical protein